MYLCFTPHSTEQVFLIPGKEGVQINAQIRYGSHILKFSCSCVKNVAKAKFKFKLFRQLKLPAMDVYTIFIILFTYIYYAVKTYFNHSFCFSPNIYGI
jgi:hypothetical protein